MNLLDLARSAIPAKAAMSEPAKRWRVRYPGAGSIEVLFTPPASLAEVAEVHPGAELDMLPEPSRRNATPSEAAELRDLLLVFLSHGSEADRVEALAVAMADPEAALESFRLLARDARNAATWGKYGR